MTQSNERRVRRLCASLWPEGCLVGLLLGGVGLAIVLTFWLTTKSGWFSFNFFLSLRSLLFSFSTLIKPIYDVNSEVLRSSVFLKKLALNYKRQCCSPEYYMTSVEKMFLIKSIEISSIGNQNSKDRSPRK